MNTYLTDIIPPTWRRYLYAAFALAAVVVGALNLAGVDTGAAVEVIAYLSIAFGAVAAANTTPNVGAAGEWEIDPEDEADYAEAGGGYYPEGDVNATEESLLYGTREPTYDPYSPRDSQ